MTISAALIAELCGGRLEGPDHSFTGVETMDLAEACHVTFAGQTIYAKKIDASQAMGAIASEGLTVQKRGDQSLIWVKNADLAVAQVLEKLAPVIPLPEVGVHPTAIVDSTAVLGQDVRIGPYVIIQGHARIGDRCVLMAQDFVGTYATMGADCVLWPQVTVRDRCSLGQRVILHPGCVIGADGFGYRFAEGRHVKIPQIGTVEIHDDCELGANTCVDRGKFSATIVGAGSKLDNFVQIGHNVRLGPHSVLVAHACIGGSVKTGPYLVMGGASGIADHVTVGTAVQLAAMSAMHRDTQDGAKMAGVPAQPARDFFSELRAVHQLPQLLVTVRALEQRIAQLESAAKDPRP